VPRLLYKTPLLLHFRHFTLGHYCSLGAGFALVSVRTDFDSMLYPEVFPVVRRFSRRLLALCNILDPPFGSSGACVLGFNNKTCSVDARLRLLQYSSGGSNHPRHSQISARASNVVIATLLSRVYQKPSRPGISLSLEPSA
jgi:hypothetical protein